MILLDDRVGSHELLPYFSPYGVQVESTRLDYGDACWVGKGPDGDCMVGVERKTIGDFISSMRGKRLAGHQLPGLMSSYEFTYLIVEGIYRPGETGELEQRQGHGKGKSGWGWKGMGVRYREVDNHLSLSHAPAFV